MPDAQHFSVDQGGPSIAAVCLHACAKGHADQLPTRFVLFIDILMNHFYDEIKA